MQRGSTPGRYVRSPSDTRCGVLYSLGMDGDPALRRLVGLPDLFVLRLPAHGRVLIEADNLRGFG
jgi:hypothetical protein